MVTKISEGAEAFIYRVGILGFDAVVKYRTRKRYRVEEMDARIRSERTVKEARVMTADCCRRCERTHGAVCR